MQNASLQCNLKPKCNQNASLSIAKQKGTIFYLRQHTNSRTLTDFNNPSSEYLSKAYRKIPKVSPGLTFDFGAYFEKCEFLISYIF